MEENKNNNQVEKNENQGENKSLAYMMGQFIGGTMGACIAILMLALTVKLVIWMF